MSKLLEEFSEVKLWRKRGYLGHAPQFVKQNIFLKYGLKKTPWIESGTYLGDTTLFLAKHFPKVYSIEPAKKLYDDACKKFASKNVELFNNTSENILKTLLPKLKGSLNFWLDGHYSAGFTYQGEKDCPIEDELKSIEDNIENFTELRILIDDVRLFSYERNLNQIYPPLDNLIDWARKHQFKWHIEQDILILQR